MRCASSTSTSVAGEFVVLLGASGSGKSTLLNILGGLDVPTARRRCATAATSSRGADEAELTRYRREHVGFVFQFYNLIPSLTARENVALVTEIAERPDDARGGARAGRPGRAARPLSRRSCRAASSSAWRSRARSRSGRTCCCATSRPARSTIETGKLVLEAIARVNRELGTTTVVITHNARDRRHGRPRAAARRRPHRRRATRNARRLRRRSCSW